MRPADLAEALGVLAEDPDAVVVAGSTDWGVEVNIRGRRATSVVAVDRLPELRGFSVTDTEVRIGAALTLSEIERRLDGRLPLLLALMPQFASPLIRNGATLGGNLGTGSPIGDSPPVLLALEASLVLASVDGERTVPLADYFTGYRESVREPGELIKRDRRPAAGGRDHRVPQDRQARLRRHLVGGGRLRARRVRRRRHRRRGSGSAASRRPRSGRWRPRPRSRASRGPQETVDAAAAVMGG